MGLFDDYEPKRKKLTKLPSGELTEDEIKDVLVKGGVPESKVPQMIPWANGGKAIKYGNTPTIVAAKPALKGGEEVSDLSKLPTSRETRLALNLSQEDFALLIGVHWVTISRWENGFGAGPTDYQKRLFNTIKTYAKRNPGKLRGIRNLVRKGEVYAALGTLLKGGSKA